MDMKDVSPAEYAERMARASSDPAGFLADRATQRDAKRISQETAAHEAHLQALRAESESPRPDDLPSKYATKDEFSVTDPEGFLAWSEGRKLILTFRTGADSFEVKAIPEETDGIIEDYRRRGVPLVRKVRMGDRPRGGR